MIYVYSLNIQKNIIFSSRKRLRNKQIAVSLDNFTDSSISDKQKSGDSSFIHGKDEVVELRSTPPDCNAL